MKRMIVVMGPNGVGKSLQTKELVERLGGVRIGSSDIVRKNGNWLHLWMINHGILVPRRTMRRLFARQIAHMPNDELGIADGYPRTRRQAKDFLDALREQHISLEAIVVFEAARQVCLNRIKRRAEQEGRKDDLDLRAVNKRLGIYFKRTVPSITVLETGSGLNATRVNGELPIEGVTSEMMEKLDVAGIRPVEPREQPDKVEPVVENAD